MHPCGHFVLILAWIWLAGWWSQSSDLIGHCPFPLLPPPFNIPSSFVFFFSFSYWTSELHNWWIRQGKPIYSRVGRGSYKTNKRTTTKPNPNSKKLPHQRIMWTSVRCFIGTGEICRQPYFKRVRTSRGLTCFCSLFWSLGLTLLCSPWR